MKTWMKLVTLSMALGYLGVATHNSIQLSEKGSVSLSSAKSEEKQKALQKAIENLLKESDAKEEFAINLTKDVLAPIKKDIGTETSPESYERVLKLAKLHTKKTPEELAKILVRTQPVIDADADEIDEDNEKLLRAAALAAFNKKHEGVLKDIKETEKETLKKVEANVKEFEGSKFKKKVGNDQYQVKVTKVSGNSENGYTMEFSYQKMDSTGAGLCAECQEVEVNGGLSFQTIKDIKKLRDKLAAIKEDKDDKELIEKIKDSEEKRKQEQIAACLIDKDSKVLNSYDKMKCLVGKAKEFWAKTDSDSLEKKAKFLKEIHDEISALLEVESKKDKPTTVEIEKKVKELVKDSPAQLKNEVETTLVALLKRVQNEVANKTIEKQIKELDSADLQVQQLQWQSSQYQNAAFQMYMTNPAMAQQYLMAAQQLRGRAQNLDWIIDQRTNALKGELYRTNPYFPGGLSSLLAPSAINGGLRESDLTMACTRYDSALGSLSLLTQETYNNPCANSVVRQNNYPGIMSNQGLDQQIASRMGRGGMGINDSILGNGGNILNSGNGINGIGNVNYNLSSARLTRDQGGTFLTSHLNMRPNNFIAGDPQNPWRNNNPVMMSSNQNWNNGGGRFNPMGMNPGFNQQPTMNPMMNQPFSNQQMPFNQFNNGFNNSRFNRGG